MPESSVSISITTQVCLLRTHHHLDLSRDHDCAVAQDLRHSTMCALLQYATLIIRHLDRRCQLARELIGHLQ